MLIQARCLPPTSASHGLRIGIVALLIALILLAPGAVAAETGVGLPPPPVLQWKAGEVRRGPGGRIRLDPAAGDPLADLTKGHRRIGMGSGFFVSRGGLVITSHHVIARCKLITVETPWNAIGAADLVAGDPTRDLALLKTDVTAPAEVMFPPRGSLQPGERLVVVGYPTLKLPPLSPQVASAVHAGPVPGGPLVLLKAAVAPGSSGGPALDTVGRLAAVIIAEINTPAFYEKTGRVIRDVAVAVPAGETERFLRTQGVTVSRSTAPTPLEPAALTALAERIVTRIGCWK